MRAYRWLFLVIVFSAGAYGQDTPAGKDKTLTSEQKAVRQQTRELDAEREKLRAAARQAFGTEMAREKAGDCANASTTSDFNGCFGEAVGNADQSMKAYEGAIRDLLDLAYPKEPGESSSPVNGSSGPSLDPAQYVAEFDHMEQHWRSYLEGAEKVAFHQFDGGLGAPSFALETHLRLVRDHMRELNKIYGEMFL